MLQFLSVCNKIPAEEGFFTFLHKLEIVKLCGISNNLRSAALFKIFDVIHNIFLKSSANIFSLKYNLSDFLALPNLHVLHVRDTVAFLDVPDVSLIRAPIDDLRICTHRLRVHQLIRLFQGLHKTLERLELQITIVLPDISNVSLDVCL